MLCRPILQVVVASFLWLPMPAQERHPFSATDRAAALKAIQAAFQTSYVFPEMRPVIIKRLEESQRAGIYDGDDPVVFADLVTKDLREVTQDKHLSLRVDSMAFKAAMAPPASEHGEEAFQRREAIRAHHGLAELKLLPGNLRYLRISGFHWVDDETGSVYDEAMRFLKEGDGVIIDLRGNGGGSHAAVRYLVSHFMPGDVLELTFLQGASAPAQSRTLEHLPAGRLMGKPLYVLIDSYVASAAEAFAYDVQQFKLGELVGARTAGAANNNRILPIAPVFMLSVSFGRPEHAVSHGNWEGVGIEPTVEAPPAKALEMAQSLALSRLSRAPGATPAALAEYAWALSGVEAGLHPVFPAADSLQRLAGRYGVLAIVYRDGALWMDWPKYPSARLVPMSNEGLFAYGDRNDLRVRLNGKTLEILWMHEDAPRVYSRNP